MAERLALKTDIIKNPTVEEAIGRFKNIWLDCFENHTLPEERSLIINGFLNSLPKDLLAKLNSPVPEEIDQRTLLTIAVKEAEEEYKKRRLSKGMRTYIRRVKAAERRSNTHSKS